MLDVSFAKPALPKSGALVLLVEEGGGPGGATGELWRAADEATGGAVSRALTAAEFKGKKGQTATILAPGGGLSRVIAVGLGKPAEAKDCAIEDAGGSAAAALAMEPAAAIAASGLSAQQAASAAFGAALRSYRFDRYRTKEKPEDKPKLKKLSVLSADPSAAKSAWEQLEAVAEGVCLTRDLVSEPGNVLNPIEMAKRCEALSKLGVKVEVMGPKDLNKLGFGLFMGVAQGSANEPRVVTMHWNGAGGRRTGGGHAGGGRKNSGAKPLAFVGKGVTFDTGGISIKPAGGMEDMKFDMGGAGTVIGLMAALAGRKAKVDAIGMVGLVENMPSGTAQRPGDVVKSYSGQTVEVINTDAEGRLVLGDLLWYCQQKYDPRFMVDLATLTGAMVISLGHEYAGFFSNDDELAQKLHAAGAASGDKCWRMPLHDAYDKGIKSDIADMKNVGGRPGGAITAAHFIKRFVNDKPWAHLDIAGTAWSTKDTPTVPKGATGYGVRLLNRLVADNYEG